MSRKYPIKSSFLFAIEGLKLAIKKEPNFKIHLTIAFLVLTSGIFFEFGTLEMAILVLTISLVLVLELINTAIEKFIDLLHPDIHPQAKIAKDISAAAVLISAIAASLVGLLLFLPKI